MPEFYSPAVIEHCRHPRNAGRLPSGDPDVAGGEAGAAAEGDLVRIQIRVGPDHVVREAAFKAFGCPATIAAASLATERVLGQSLACAVEFAARDLAQALSLSPDRAHSAELARGALAAAVEAFRRKRGLDS